jgi:hypothetical protein
MCWLMLFDPSSALTNIKKALLSLCQTLLHPVTFIQAAIPEFLDSVGLDFMKNKVKRQGNDKMGNLAKLVWSLLIMWSKTI